MQRSLDTADRDVEKWFRQARNARSMQEMLACLQRAHRLDPYHSQAQQLTRRALWRILQKEPFLAYRDETDHLRPSRPQMGVFPRVEVGNSPLPPARNVRHAYRRLSRNQGARAQNK